MLDTSKNVLFPGHNNLLTTGTHDPSFAGSQAIIKLPAHQYRWLAGGYDLEIGYFSKWLAWLLYLGDSGLLARYIISRNFLTTLLSRHKGKQNE